MKKLYKLLLMIIILQSSLQLKASHVIGGYITYKYLSPLTYKVSLIVFFDCANGTVPSPIVQNVCITSASCGYSTMVDLYNESYSYRPDNPCSPTAFGKCTGGYTLGLMDVVYSDTVVLPFACADWIMHIEFCCASVAITNLLNAAAAGVYNFATLDNLNFPVNSLPQYNQLIYNQYCVGNFTSVNLSCTDADGDSISYQLSPSHDASGFCNTYIASDNPYVSPYSFNQPFASSTPQFMDSINGLYYLTPSQLQIGRLAVTIKEFRNGLLLDSMSREDMLVFANYVPNPDTITGKIFHDLNNDGIQNPGEQAIKNRLIGLDSLNTYTFSDTSGKYLFRLPIGTYHVEVPNLSPFINCNPQSHTVIFTAPAVKSSNNNFAITYNPGIKDLRVSITGLAQPVVGFMSDFQVDYANAGTDTVFNPFIKFIVDSNINLFFSNPNYDSISGNNLFWNKSLLVPGQAGKIIVYYDISATLSVGTNINATAEIYPIVTDTFPSDNTYSLDQLTQGQPFDPNYKTAEPSGDVSTQFIADNSYLVYTVHFQNTGSSPALYVDVKDTLDNNLDLSTFEFLSSSHNCIPQLNAYGYYKIIDFIFNGINLPDSGSNGPASHGFVKFRIKPKNNLVIGDAIENSAQIFFDLNTPVPTNEVITNVIAPAGIENDFPMPTEILVYPNPSKSLINVRISLGRKEKVQLRLLNLLGEEIYKINDVTRSKFYEHQFSLENLPKGIYVISIKTDKQIGVRKIIKQ